MDLVMWLRYLELAGSYEDLAWKLKFEFLSGAILEKSIRVIAALLSGLVPQKVELHYPSN
jgi:hypothetical protein